MDFFEAFTILIGLLIACIILLILYFTLLVEIVKLPFRLLNVLISNVVNITTQPIKSILSLLTLLAMLLFGGGLILPALGVDIDLPDIKFPEVTLPFFDSGGSSASSQGIAKGSNCPLSGNYLQVRQDITRLRFHSEPNGSILAYAVVGDCYPVLEIRGNWGKISSENLGTGWVSISSEYVELFGMSEEPELLDTVEIPEEFEVDEEIIEADASAWLNPDVPSLTWEEAYQTYSLDPPSMDDLSTLGDIADVSDIVYAALDAGKSPISPVGNIATATSISVNFAQCISPENTEGLKPCGKALADGSTALGTSLMASAFPTAAANPVMGVLVGLAGAGLSGLGLVGRFLLK